MYVCIVIWYCNIVSKIVVPRLFNVQDMNEYEQQQLKTKDF